MPELGGAIVPAGRGWGSAQSVAMAMRGNTTQEMSTCARTCCSPASTWHPGCRTCGPPASMRRACLVHRHRHSEATSMGTLCAPCAECSPEWSQTPPPPRWRRCRLAAGRGSAGRGPTRPSAALTWHHGRRQPRSGCPPAGASPARRWASLAGRPGAYYWGLVSCVCACTHPTRTARTIPAASAHWPARRGRLTRDGGGPVQQSPSGCLRPTPPPPTAAQLAARLRRHAVRLSHAAARRQMTAPPEQAGGRGQLRRDAPLSAQLDA